MRVTFTLFVILFTCFSWAQNPSELQDLKKLYPEYDYVVIQDQTHVDISHDKEKGIRIIKSVERSIYLTSDRAGLFKDNQIYSSYFERLLDKEAYALNKKKDKDRYKKKKVREFNTEEAISEEVFYDDGIVTSFSYEGLKEESIIKMAYTKELTDPHLSFSEFFGAGYPTLNKSLTITVDDGIKLSTVYFNMDSTAVNYTKTSRRNKTIYSWKKDTVDIYKSEPSSLNSRYFIPHCVSRINYYYNENGEKVGVLENVQDLYNWYASMISQVGCKSEEELKEIIEKIISPDDTELEKVKKVFQWVQGNIKYIAIEDGLGGFIPRDPSLVMSRRYGDCKDMSTLIIQLLEMQGINAHRVWIGTRDIPYKYEELPSPVIDNHMIAAYFNKKTNQYIFLDATDSQVAFGYPTDFIQGKEALISRGDSYEIVDVPVLSADKTRMTDHLRAHIEDEELIGEGKLSMTGYYAVDYKYLLSRVSNEKKKKSQVESITKKGNNKYKLENYSISKDGNLLQYNYTFSIPSYINKTDNEIYVNMNLEPLESFFSPYEVKDRKRGVKERYASTSKYAFTLVIPEGYKLDYVPENLFFDGGDDFHVIIDYNVDVPGEITYNFDLVLDYITLDLDRIPKIVEMGKKMKSAYKETIVLKKKEHDEQN